MARPSAFARRIVGGLCLLIYLQVSGVIPELLAFAVAMEGSHSVGYSHNAGTVRIVLHHASNQRIAHQHGLGSRVICQFAARPADAQADHTAAFDCNSLSEKWGEKSKLKTINFVRPAFFRPPSPPLAKSVRVRSLAASSVAAREPERCCVLLI
ncbi:MAG: hypothetical protein ACXWKG_15430 [Limisphaerales bacterium]